MAPPTWLPPLNLHKSFNIAVTLSERDYPYNIHSKSSPHFLFKINVLATFFSDRHGNERIFKALDSTETYVMPCSLITPQMENNKTQVKAMLDYVSVPFPLQKNIRFWHGGQNGDTMTPYPEMDNIDSFLENFCKILVQMKEHNLKLPYVNVFPLNLVISKKITVSDSEIKAWCSWYNKMAKVDPEFEHDYSRAITRPRTWKELDDESLFDINMSGNEEDQYRPVGDLGDGGASKDGESTRDKDVVQPVKESDKIGSSNAKSASDKSNLRPSELKIVDKEGTSEGRPFRRKIPNMKSDFFYDP